MTGAGAPLRVHYLFTRFPSGSETFAGNDIRTLRALGVDVTVHALAPGEPPARHLESWGLGGLRVHPAGAGQSLAGLLAMCRYPRATASVLGLVTRACAKRPGHLLRSLLLLPSVLAVYARVRAAAPDVVHAFWGHYPALVTWLVARHMPATVSSMFLGAYDLVQDYAPSVPIANRVDVLWTHTHANVPEMVRRGIEAPVRVAYRGVDLARYAAVARDKMPGSIVAIGRLDAEKGQDDALRAFARILPRHPHARLRIVGSGPRAGALATLARDLGIDANVEFTGYMAHGRVFALLGESEVLLHMSRETTERLPNVIKEAMACDTCCICSTSPGIEELVPAGAGIVVGHGDVDAAAQALDALFSDGARRAALAAAAHAHVVAHFDLAACMRQYLQTWQALAARRQAGAA
jgi:glycosyltransferase involved in cell wall biosynthesis